ncbi:TonB family protein [Trinickia sp. YCB016]
MNSGFRRLLTAGDAPKVRLAFAFAIAAAVWVVFLTHFARLFVQDERPPPAPETIEMKLVEVVPPAPERMVSVVPQASEPLQHQVSKPQPSRATPPVVRREAIEPAKQVNVPQRNVPPPVESPAAPARAAPAADATATGVRAAASASEASPASSSAGTVQARLLSQPLPMLPDDLREDAFRAEAVARFDIHADGSTEVELVKPTSNPRLNQILLEALHKWRFFPAMENGRAVGSQRDVRVHFNVS